MAITRITNTRNGTSAISYVLKPKVKDRERVRAISGSNVLVGPRGENVANQMKSTREAFNKNKDYVQAYRVIQSFGKDELNPESQKDIAKCNRLGFELAQEAYPEHEVLVVTHTDGIGGNLHNHLVINSVNFATGKSLRGMEKDWGYVSRKSDEVLIKNGMKPIEKKEATNRKTQAEVELAERGEYVWKDDLKNRIYEALGNESITSRDEYSEYMNEEYNVDVKFRGKKSMSYGFVDEDDKQRRIRAKRLGSDFDLQEIDNVFQSNQEKIKEEEDREAMIFDNLPLVMQFRRKSRKARAENKVVRQQRKEEPTPKPKPKQNVRPVGRSVKREDSSLFASVMSEMGSITDEEVEERKRKREEEKEQRRQELLEELERVKKREVEKLSEKVQKEPKKVQKEPKKVGEAEKEHREPEREDLKKKYLDELRREREQRRANLVADYDNIAMNEHNSRYWNQNEMRFLSEEEIEWYHEYKEELKHRKRDERAQDVRQIQEEIENEGPEL